MNSIITFFLIGLFIVNFSFAQPDTAASFKKGKYKVFIRFIENNKSPKKIKGFPVALSDSGLWITKGIVHKKNISGARSYEIVFIEAHNINRIWFRRKGRIGIGILVGSIAGFVAGGSIGSSISEDNNATNGPVFINTSAIEALPYFVIGLYTGGSVGGLAGGRIRKRFRIGGNLENFITRKDNMVRYLPTVRKN